jgi:hypothetical protein
MQRRVFVLRGVPNTEGCCHLPNILASDDAPSATIERSLRRLRCQPPHHSSSPAGKQAGKVAGRRTSAAAPENSNNCSEIHLKTVESTAQQASKRASKHGRTTLQQSAGDDAAGCAVFVLQGSLVRHSQASLHTCS